MQPVLGRMPGSGSNHMVVGVDVGGPRKGYHAVALLGGQFWEKLATPDAAALVEWCRARQAAAVGIDAPCRWSLTGRARRCERELAGAGITSFATPSRAVGRSHPFYRWMVGGAALFEQLAPHYRLFNGADSPAGPVCFETFPHAIACALAGERLSATHKQADRRRVLSDAGVSTAALRTIDEIDAALCAVAAAHLLAGAFTGYGDIAEGFLLVPAVLTPHRPAIPRRRCARRLLPAVAAARPRRRGCTPPPGR